MEIVVLPNFSGVAKDMSEFLSPKEGIDGKIVVKTGMIKSRSVGCVKIVMMYQKSTGNASGYAKYENGWQEVISIGGGNLYPYIERFIT